MYALYEKIPALEHCWKAYSEHQSIAIYARGKM